MSPGEFWNSNVIDVSHAFRGFIDYKGGGDGKLDADEVNELLAWMEEYG